MPQEGSSEGEMLHVPLDSVAPNPYQPRQVFEEGAIEELADSIRRVGVLEPVLIRPNPEAPPKYQLLVGERRLRASRIAGKETIPAVLRYVDDGDMALLGLVENLQREDLHPLEEAAAIRRMLDEFAITQEELARGLGFSQSAIANKLRLLQLAAAVREAAMEAGLGERHVRSLLRVPEVTDQLAVVHRVSTEGLSVKETENLIDSLLSGPQSRRKKRRPVRGIVRDLRIFINGLRQTADAIREAGFDVEVEETELDEGFRIVLEVRGKATDKTEERENG